MKKWSKILFVFILFLSAFIRFYQLDRFPPSPNWDEISHGVNAQSILETGADQWGQKIPLFNFRAYGDYPTVANMYLTVPFIKIFGLNTLSIRLPSAIFGFLFVPLIFFLCQALFGQTRLSLIAMLVAAIAPWSFFPSRAVFQSTIATTFLVAAITFFFYFYSHHKSYFIFLSSLFLGLSMYAYHNTRLIAPLIFICLFVFIKKPFKKTILPILLFLLFAIPSLINLFSPDSRARGYWVSIINPSAIHLINEQRRLYEGPPILNRLFHNKITYAVPQITLNFLNFFNPIPLFFTGTGQHQFNVAGLGLLFPVWLPFFYLGLLSLWRYRQKVAYRFLIFWLVVGLLPAIITSGDFASIRATTAMPVYLILIALGIHQSLHLLPIILVIAISFFSFLNYFYLYLTSYPKNYSQSWQFGYQEAIEVIKPLYPKYDHIYVTKKYGEPHEFILFFWPWSLAKYQTDPNLKWDYHDYWYWVNSFDKFVFLNDWEIKNFSPPKNSLLVTSPQNYPGKPAKISTVKFLDQSVAFDIVSYD